MGVVMNWRTQIEAAAERISPHIRKTPVERAHHLGPNVWLKCENMQVTGSFKVRGGTNALLKLNREQRKKGVVTASSGNHGLGLAHAAQQLKIPATVFVTDIFSFSTDLPVRVPPDHLVRVQETPCAFVLIRSSAFALLSHRNSVDSSFT